MFPVAQYMCCFCAAAVEADFLGFGSTQAAAEEAFLPESPPAEPSGFSTDTQTAAQPSPIPTPPTAATPDGLADFFSTSATEPAPFSSSAADRSSTAHIDDMFSAAPKPVASQRPNQASSGAAPATRGSQSSASSSSAGVGAGGGSAPRGAAAAPKPAARPPAPSSMIDFGDEAAMLAQNPDLYQGLEAVEGVLHCMSVSCLSFILPFIHNKSYRGVVCCVDKVCWCKTLTSTKG